MTSPLTRRDLLRLATLAAGAVAATPFGPIGLDAAPRGAQPAPFRPLSRRGAPKNIVIVGAGLAGLSAAFELMEAGHQVTVLEGQLRPGGRVRTLRAPFADGLHAELGAARIPDNHAWTHEYVKLFNLPLTPFYPPDGDSLTVLRGTRVRAKPGAAPDVAALPVTLTPDERAMGLGGLFGKALGQAVHDAGDRAHWPAASIAAYDKLTLKELVRRQGLSPDAWDAMGLSAFTSQSALEVVTMMSSGHGSKVMSKIAGGNDRLPDAFAARLGDRIRYGARVTRLEQDQQGVRVRYLQGDSPRTVTGDKLICAIPFPVLRHLEVVPALAPPKARAVREMVYGSLARITLQVRKRYWLDQGLSGFANIDLPGEVWHPTFDLPGPRGLLQLYLQGPSSEHASGLSEDARIKYAIEAVERVYPGLREHVEGAEAMCWDRDPWARGAVRLMNVGQVAALHAHVATPDGHIHFAGEHTSTWFCWMNGAIESGVRAAREINES